MSLQMSASQTIGPYLHIGTDWLTIADLAPAVTDAQRIVVQGRMLDGNGRPVDDGLVELWQANQHGRYADPQDARELPLQAGFRGFGRVPTDSHGGFRFSTIKPGCVPGAGTSWQAPHIAVNIFARGLLKQLVTRIYFPDDAANDDDPVLALVPASRRSTLIARAGTEPGVLEWNIVLQGGADETVFFDI
jgi:protocatechuate 3,4-dioxygenase alpha subunit